MWFCWLELLLLIGDKEEGRRDEDEMPELELAVDVNDNVDLQVSLLWLSFCSIITNALFPAAILSLLLRPFPADVISTVSVVSAGHFVVGEYSLWIVQYTARERRRASTEEGKTIDGEKRNILLSN